MAYSSRLKYVCMNHIEAVQSVQIISSTHPINRYHTISFQIKPAEGRGAPEAKTLVFTSAKSETPVLD